MKPQSIFLLLSFVAQAVCADAINLTFQQDIQPILQRRCMPCHTANFYYPESKHGCRGMITFENKALGSVFGGGPLNGQSTGCPDVDLYGRLTTLQAWGCTSKKYVQPGQPANSFILRKLRGQECDGKQIHKPPSQITEDEIQKIEDWIRAGAKR